VSGTGFAREFVPTPSRGNIFDRLARRSRPLWAQKPFNGPNKNPKDFIMPLIFNKRSTLQLAKVLLSEKSYSITKQIVALYSYGRFVKFISKVEIKFIPKLYRNIKNKIISILIKRKKQSLILETKY